MFWSMMFVNSNGIFIRSYSQMLGRIGFDKFSTLLITCLHEDWGYKRTSSSSSPPQWREKTTARRMRLLLLFLLALPANNLELPASNIGKTLIQVSHVHTSYRWMDGWMVECTGLILVQKDESECCRPLLWMRPKYQDTETFLRICEFASFSSAICRLPKFFRDSFSTTLKGTI